MYIRCILVVEILLVVTIMANLNETPRTYCGKRLTKTLSNFCRGRYNSMLDTQPEERLDMQSTYTYNASPLVANNQQPDAASSRSKRRIRRQDDLWYVHHGIIDECCKKPCTLNVLMSYCRTPTTY